MTGILQILFASYAGAAGITADFLVIAGGGGGGGYSIGAGASVGRGDGGGGAGGYRELTSQPLVVGTA